MLLSTERYTVFLNSSTLGMSKKTKNKKEKQKNSSDRDPIMLCNGWKMCTRRQTAMKGSVDKVHLTAGGQVFVSTYFNVLSTAQQHKVLLTALAHQFLYVYTHCQKYNVHIASSMPAYCTMTLY